MSLEEQKDNGPKRLSLSDSDDALHIQNINKRVIKGTGGLSDQKLPSVPTPPKHGKQ